MGNSLKISGNKFHDDWQNGKREKSVDATTNDINRSDLQCKEINADKQRDDSF
jgi:hypothetical protein